MEQERLKLSQSLPWSEEETGACAISMLISALGYGLLYWAFEGPHAGLMQNPHVPMGSPAYNVLIPDPYHISPWMAGIFVLAGLVMLNLTPIKRLHGFLQYLVCAVCAGFIPMDAYASVYGQVLVGIFGGGILFMILRVNWWFYWDNPSRRTLSEKVLCSILYTCVYPLGFAMGFWRWMGVGVGVSTTVFGATPDGKPLETIPENPALAEHARRMEAIRAAQAGVGSGRKPSEDKNVVSESI